MAPSTPEHRPLILVDLFFPDDDINYGDAYIQFNYKATVNGGYIVMGQLVDPAYQTLNRLVQSSYKEDSRKKILQMRFRIKNSLDATYPESATKFQVANVISLKGESDGSNNAYISFVGIDPPSWHLNSGNGTGEVFTGNLSSAVKQVIQKYAPNVKSEVSQTTDSNQNKWAMLRQDPKTFIKSLIEWSPSVTPKRTNWMVTVDGGEFFGSESTISIKEQAEMQSVQRATYTFNKRGSQNTISSWELLTNNALSLVDTQLITQGLSSTTGTYFDSTTDLSEREVVVSDKTTANKIIPKTNKIQATSKPSQDTENPNNSSGVTAIVSIPEHNAGDLGIKYQSYIDGVARNYYLNLLRKLTQIKVTVIGHGEWTGCQGLGVDTVYLDWYDAMSEPYFLSGNWQVQGYEHYVDSAVGSWRTDLYLSRSDWDVQGTKVPI